MKLDDEQALGTLFGNPRVIVVLVAVGLWAILSAGALVLDPAKVFVVFVAMVAGASLLVRPAAALVGVLALRVVMDLLWWMGRTAVGLNLMELFSAFATGGVFALVLLHFDEIQEHPALPWVVPFLGLLTLASLRTGGVQGLESLAKLGGPVVILLAVSMYAKEARWQDRILAGITVAGAIPVLYSTWCVLTHRHFEPFAGAERLVGAFQNPTEHALTMLFMSCLGVYWVDRLKGWGRVAAGAYALAALVCLYYANTRATELGFAVFAGIYLARQRRWSLLAAALVGAVALYLSSDLMQARFGKLATEAFSGPTIDDPTGELGSGRWSLWTASMEAFLRRPAYDLVLGAGAAQEKAYYLVKDPHNDYLSVLYQAGPIAVISLVGILWGAVRRVWEPGDPSDRPTYLRANFLLALVVACAFVSFMTNGFISRTAPAWYFFAAAGLAYVFAASESSEAEVEAPKVTRVA